MAPQADKTIADRIYRQMRSDIIGGRLIPGRKLKLEALTQDYAVGMSPLREALAKLTGDLLVVSEGQRGFWVAPLSLDELDDVSRVRALIETEALSASIYNGDAAWERNVTDTFEALAAIEERLPHTDEALPPEVIESWETCNRAFHAALVSAARSPILIKLRDLLYQQSERYRRVSLNVSRVWRNVHDEHRAIYDATMQRNALRACRMIELHLARTSQEVRKAMAARVSEGEQARGEAA